MMSPGRAANDPGALQLVLTTISHGRIFALALPAGKVDVAFGCRETRGEQMAACQVSVLTTPSLMECSQRQVARRAAQTHFLPFVMLIA
jgi:hypothetical protein